MIRVLVADDQPVIRTALRALLETAADVEVVGEAADGEAAVVLSASLRPDVVLMDVRMRLDGIEATRRLRGAAHRPATVVLTTFGLDDYVLAAVRAGAAGFLLKDGEAADLLRAVRAAAAGQAMVSPEVMAPLLAALATVPGAKQDALDAVGTLTARERDVLVLMARGCPNAEIALRLFISEGTAKTHVGRILAKVGARDRAQAVVVAYESGLVKAGLPQD